MVIPRKRLRSFSIARNVASITTSVGGRIASTRARDRKLPPSRSRVESCRPTISLMTVARRCSLVFAAVTPATRKPSSAAVNYGNRSVESPFESRNPQLRTARCRRVYVRRIPRAGCRTDAGFARPCARGSDARRCSRYSGRFARDTARSGTQRSTGSGGCLTECSYGARHSRSRRERRHPRV